MNEELNKVLIDAIQKTQSGIGEAVDFAVAQAPDVIQQLLMWHFVNSLINCALGIVCFVIIFLFVRFVQKYPQPDSFESNNLVWWDKGELHPVTGIFGGLGVCILGLAGFILMNLTWLKIWIAPKLYLIEYAASLVK